MPSLLTEEEFEDDYRLRFERLLHGQGLLIDFRRDRAGLDAGLVLAQDDSRKLSNVKVWFQLKGKHKETLSATQLEERGSVDVSVDIEHLKYWYASPEAIYLVTYIEATDMFLAEDVQDIVDRQWGTSILSPQFLPGQKTVTVHISSELILDTRAIRSMARHQSMRIDGPAFRGRPLGHRLDPLRCDLAELHPKVFMDVVDDLLKAHRFKMEKELDVNNLLILPENSRDQTKFIVGTFHTTYEWIFSLGVEYGHDGTGSPREEGQTFHAFGKVAILVLGNHLQAKVAERATDFLKQLEEEGVTKILVIANAEERNILGTYGRMMGRLSSIPQGLGSLSYSVLTCTLIYLKYRDQLVWKTINYNY